MVKDPAQSGNNHAYESQTCQFLDRLEKIQNSTLATSIHNTGIQFGDTTLVEDDDDDETGFRKNVVSTTAQLLPFLWTSGYHIGTPRIVDYFYRADLMK